MDVRGLQGFCSDDENRPSLYAPFSMGRHTYATSAHIGIRVPRLKEVPEQKNAPNLEKLLEEAKGMKGTVIALPEFSCPECEKCGNCEKWGSEQTYLSATYPAHGPFNNPCPECEGSEQVRIYGKESQNPSVQVGNAFFNPWYLILIRDLPGLKFYPRDDEFSTAYFEFDGGDGLIGSCNGEV